MIGTVTGDYLYVDWEGTNGFADDQLITDDTPSSNTTYTFSAYGATDNNLVVNGDFELGNVNFTSNYLLGEDFCPASNPWGILGCEGMYTINTNASNTHTNFAPCVDHTSGTGQMMIVNGSSVPIDVWCQDIVVTPNSDYLFSAWATSVVSGSPAILQFSINGLLIGDDFNLSSTTCDWQNFTAPWNSGPNAVATICVTNQNTAVGGNDFALDDIEFLEVCREEASFDVTIAEVLGVLPTSNSIDCDIPTASLEVVPDNPNYSYNWDASFGGIIAGPNDQASVVGTSAGLYQVTITDENGCTKKLTTSVNGSTDPPTSAIAGDFVLSCDMNLVTVFSSNQDAGNTYNWIGSYNNSTSTSAIYNVAGNYLLEIVNQFNCLSYIPFTITNIAVSPDYDLAMPDTLACIGDSTSVSIEFQQTPENVTWYDPSGNIISSVDSASAYDIGYYVVEMNYNNGCTFYDSVNVVSDLSQLDYSLGESPTLDCNSPSQSIDVVVNGNYQTISWILDTLISNDPSITVDQEGTYVVEIADDNGCITRDTILVFSDFANSPYDINSSEIDCIDGEGEIHIVSDSTLIVSWVLPDGSVDSGNDIVSSQTGDYIYSVESSNGCTVEDTIILTANQNFPVLDLAFNDLLTCIDKVSNIIIESNIPDTDYEWTGPNMFESQESDFVVNAAGDYIYIATTADGCTSSDTITIFADQLVPEIVLTADTLNCLNTVAAININSAQSYEITGVNSPDYISQNLNTVFVGAGGITTIAVIGDNGCTNSQEIDIQEDFTVPDSIGLSNFMLDCANIDSTLSIVQEANTSVYWLDLPDTLSFTNEFTVDQSGNFQLLTINNTSGCQMVSPFSVTDDFQADNFTVDASNINCTNPIATIDLGFTQDVSTIDFMSDLTQESDIEYSTEMAELYNFIVTYSNGCTAEASGQVLIDTISPIVTTEDSNLSCDGNPITLIGDTNVSVSDFNWTGPGNFSSNDSAPMTSEAGVYTLIVTDNDNGCTGSSSLEVFADMTIIEITHEVTQPLCPGDIGSVSFYISGANPGDPISETLINSQSAPSDPNNLASGFYYYEYIDANGCSGLDSIEVEDVTEFQAKLPDEITVSSGEDTQIIVDTDLSTAEILSISWSPETNLSCTDCLDPFVSGLTEDTQYQVTITNINGCTQIDSVTIRVVVDFKFYVSNIFSPDDNGQNDIFFIQSNAFAAGSIITEMAIYDRWGNAVFLEKDFPPNDSNFGWRGQFKGSNAQQGVYAFYAIIELPNGEIEKLVGDIVLVR